MSTLTVIIPTRNMASTLGRAIESAKDADEIIVIDDASEDDTESVVRSFDGVKYIRHAEKSIDHNSAQREYWTGVKTEQIVGLAADDWLYPGAIEALKSCSSAPVVFSEIDFFSDSGSYLGSFFHHFYGNKTHHDVRKKFAIGGAMIESGFASAVRADISRWLWNAGWDRLGPMMDSVGLSAAACLFGATYLNVKGGAFTLHNVGSYGMNQNRTAEDYYQLGCTAVSWMFSVGLDSKTIKQIAHARCCLSKEFLERI